MAEQGVGQVQVGPQGIDHAVDDVVEPGDDRVLQAVGPRGQLDSHELHRVGQRVAPGAVHPRAAAGVREAEQAQPRAGAGHETFKPGAVHRAPRRLVSCRSMAGAILHSMMNSSGPPALARLPPK